MADAEQHGDTTNGLTSNGAEDNKFQQAIAAWRAIDLTHLIPTLDTTASDLVTKQKDSLVERKELAQKTKDFRKLDDTEKLVEVKALLKCMCS
jgi:homeobox protein cut-like